MAPQQTNWFDRVDQKAAPTNQPPTPTQPAKDWFASVDVAAPTSPPSTGVNRGVLGEFGAGVMRGAEQTASSLGTIMKVLGVKDNPLSEMLRNQGELIHSHWEKAAATHPQSADIQGNVIDKPSLLVTPKWWASSIGETLPSLAASMIPAGGAARAITIGGRALQLSPVVIAKLARLGGAITGGLVGGSLEGANTFEQVKARGGSDADAVKAFLEMGGASAIFNAISLDRYLGANGSLAKRFLQGGGVEAFTEWLEEPTEALILGDDLLQGANEGLNVVPASFLLGGLGGAMGGTRPAPAPAPSGGPVVSRYKRSAETQEFIDQRAASEAAKTNAVEGTSAPQTQTTVLSPKPAPIQSVTPQDGASQSKWAVASVTPIEEAPTVLAKEAAVEASNIIKSKPEWTQEEVKSSVTRLEALLRQEDLPAEQRPIAEALLSNFKSMLPVSEYTYEGLPSVERAMQAGPTKLGPQPTTFEGGKEIPRGLTPIKSKMVPLLHPEDAREILTKYDKEGEEAVSLISRVLFSYSQQGMSPGLQRDMEIMALAKYGAGRDYGRTHKESIDAIFEGLNVAFESEQELIREGQLPGPSIIPAKRLPPLETTKSIDSIRNEIAALKAQYANLELKDIAPSKELPESIKTLSKKGDEPALKAGVDLWRHYLGEGGTIEQANLLLDAANDLEVKAQYAERAARDLPRIQAFQQEVFNKKTSGIENAQKLHSENIIEVVDEDTGRVKRVAGETESGIAYGARVVLDEVLGRRRVRVGDPIGVVQERKRKAGKALSQEEAAFKLQVADRYQNALDRLRTAAMNFTIPSDLLEEIKILEAQLGHAPEKTHGHPLRQEVAAHLGIAVKDLQETGAGHAIDITHGGLPVWTQKIQENVYGVDKGNKLLTAEEIAFKAKELRLEQLKLRTVANMLSAGEAYKSEPIRPLTPQPAERTPAQAEAVEAAPTQQATSPVEEGAHKATLSEILRLERQIAKHEGIDLADDTINLMRQEARKEGLTAKQYQDKLEAVVEYLQRDERGFLKFSESTHRWIENARKDLDLLAKRWHLTRAQLKEDYKQYIAPVASNAYISDTAFIYKGGIDQSNNRARAQADIYHKMFSRLPKDEIIAFHDRKKNGILQPTQELQDFDDFLSFKADEQYAKTNTQLQEYAALTGKEFTPTKYLEYYDSIVWNNPMAASGFFAKTKSFYGSRSWLKEHVYNSMGEGIAHGLEPRYWNPVENFNHVWENRETFIQSLKLVNKWITDYRDGKPGARFKKIGESLAEDEGYLEGSALQVFFYDERGIGPTKVGDWVINKEYARMLNNYLSVDQIRKRAVWRAILGWRRTVGAWKMFGFFHVFNVGWDSISAASSFGVRNMFEGAKKLDIGLAMKGARDFLEAFASPVTYIKHGARLQKAELSENEFWQTPEGEALVRFTGMEPVDIKARLELIFKGGGKNAFGPEQRYRIGALNAYNRSFANMIEGYGKQRALEGTKQLIKTGATAPFALAEYTMQWLFEYVVPALKMTSVFLDLDQTLTEHAYLLKSGKVSEVKLAREVVNRSEFFLGELNLDNSFWNKTQRTMATGIYRSFTWRGGTVGALYTAMLGQAKQVKRSAQAFRDPTDVRSFGEKLPILDGSFARFIGLFMTTAFVNAIIQKILTGKDPEELRDLINAKIGGVDDRGKPRRLAGANYLGRGDFEAVIAGYKTGPLLKRVPLVGYAVGGTADLWAQVIEGYDNRAFDGGYIVPKAEQDSISGLFFRMSHMLLDKDSYLPGTMARTGWEWLNTSGISKPLAYGLTFTGHTIGSRALDMTSAELLAQRLGSNQAAQGPFTQEQLERFEIMRKLSSAIRNNEPTGAIINEGLNSYRINDQDIDAAYETAQMPLLVNQIQGGNGRAGLDLEDSLRVYSIASPEERKLIRPYIDDKLDTIDDIEDPVEQERLDKLYRETMQSTGGTK